MECPQLWKVVAGLALVTACARVEESVGPLPTASVVTFTTWSDVHGAMQPLTQELSSHIHDVLENGWVGEHGGLEDYLQRNQLALAKLHVGLEVSLHRERMQREPQPNAFPVDARLLESRDLARLMLLEARRRQRRGDHEGALEECLTVLRFAREHERGQSTLIPTLISWSLRSLAMPCYEDLLREPKAPAAAWQRALDELNEMSASWPNLEQVYRADRAAMLAMTEESMKADLGSDDLAEVERTLAHVRLLDEEFSQLFATAYRAGDPACYNEAVLELESELEQLQSSAGLAGLLGPEQRAEVTAKVVLAVSLPRTGSLIELDSMRSAELEMMRTATALRVHALEHGSLPEALGDLVPKYVAELPEDPFSPAGEEIRWVRKGRSWWLYSLGPDGIDQGGEKKHDPAAAQEGGDLVLVGAYEG